MGWFHNLTGYNQGVSEYTLSRLDNEISDRNGGAGKTKCEKCHEWGSNLQYKTHSCPGFTQDLNPTNERQRHWWN